MKFNWGTAMALVMGAFMIFILSFVYKTFTNEKYNHHLVSKEYYKDEMNFQQEIDAVANAKKLNSSIQLRNSSKGLYILFPSELSEISGTIHLQRPSTDKSDVNLPIKLLNNEILISDKKLINGLYNVKIEWESNGIKYLFKDKHFY